MSAKGAGTDALSKDKLRTIANIDVGGGTSNIAVYNRGDLVAVACLDIGGRLICIDSGVVSFVAPSIRQLAERYQIPLRVGVPADRNMLRQICDKMANALFAAVNCASSPAGELEPLSTNEGDLLPADLTISGITFSGGVADCLYHPSTEDDLRYGDVGPILAKAILAHPALQKIELYPVTETIRATVVGAGSHTVEVSGSTISYAVDQLPLQNVPLLHVLPDDEKDLAALEESIKRQLPLFMPEGKPELVAVSITGEEHTGFAAIQELATALIRGAESIIAAKLPLIIISKNDIGKALGHALNVQLERKVPVLCIDGIQTISGDYIDVGNPIAEGRVVPVVIKTLVFNTART